MSKRYKALLQERADLVKEQKGIFETVERDSRDLTAEEKTRDDAIHARLTALGDDLQREERRREHERTLPGAPVPEMGGALTGGMPRLLQDPKRGWNDVAHFALAVMEMYRPGGRTHSLFAEEDEALDEARKYLGIQIGAAPTNYHQETGSDEGRMVPPAFKEAIFEVVMEGDDSLVSVVDAEPTSSNAVEILADESTPWGATGVQANWRVEGVQLTASKLTTQGRLVKLHELYAFVLATGELLQDAPRLADRLTRKAGLAIRYKQNEAIVNGTGAGQPLGWFTHTAKVSVAKETAQAAATIVAANVAKMYARLIGIGQGIWYVNQDCLPQLVTMTLGNNTIYMPPSSGFQNTPGGFLLGRPVVPLENCQTVGTQGDIQFVNPKGYYATHKGGDPAFAESIHLFFDYNIQAFRWLFRLGGEPYLSAALTPAKGSTTRSHG